MIIRYTPNIIDKYPDVFKIIEQSYFRDTVNYVTNWKYRRAIELVPWLEAQIKNPSSSVQNFANTIPDNDNYDYLMSSILSTVRKELLYKGDITHWKVEEYWATAEETITGTSVVDGITYGPMEGDCEDGAILMYVIARLKGVPAHRLMLMAGSVIGGGHCWLAYRANEYPLNWVFMDWCYNDNLLPVSTRTMYYIGGVNIHGWFKNYDIITGQDTSYQKLWFAFNENSGHYRLDFSYKYREDLT